jgi:hypothetical protein
VASRRVRRAASTVSSGVASGLLYQALTDSMKSLLSNHPRLSGLQSHTDTTFSPKSSYKRVERFSPPVVYEENKPCPLLISFLTLLKEC